MRWIALLRGVNVGGHRKVPMAQLRTVLGEHGFDRVQTYVQSGNVVLDADETSAARVAERIGQAIEGAFGFAVPVELRTGEELAATVAANPFPEAAATPTQLHVAFLSDTVDPDRLATVDGSAFAPERFALRGRELYLWLPDGIGRSKLAQTLNERRLGVTMTARNWRTVEALLAMATDDA